MNICDIIIKTKRKAALTENEIIGLIESYLNGNAADYQMAAWLMAVCFNELTEEETTALTLAMRDSGDILDLSKIDGITVDKHSTGGIGDKTSLIIAPICAACGISVPKMSGRGLGFTGGTIDKLESIPGFCTEIKFNDYINAINNNGCAIISQSGKLVPADKKLYALRDVTGTVDSIPLICSSIMSKKLATGCDCILLDVKTGSGAFMKNEEDAIKLAKLMVKIGRNASKKCSALITDMDEPLGNAVGNSLEVIEAIEILKGNEKGRLYDLCIGLASEMMVLAGKGEINECRDLAENAIKSGEALNKFKKMIIQQGGDSRVIDDYSLFPQAKYKFEVKALNSGYIYSINSEEIGMVSLMTGAGRANKESIIDYGAGIILNVHKGDSVEEGEVLMTLYSNKLDSMDEAVKRAVKAVEIRNCKPEIKSIILKYI